MCLGLSSVEDHFKKFNYVNNLPKSVYFFKDFIYLFLEKGIGRERERERNIDVWLPLAHPPLGTWPATQACALDWG